MAYYFDKKTWFRPLEKGSPSRKPVTAEECQLLYHLVQQFKPKESFPAGQYLLKTEEGSMTIAIPFTIKMVKGGNALLIKPDDNTILGQLSLVKKNGVSTFEVTKVDSAVTIRLENITEKTKEKFEEKLKIQKYKVDRALWDYENEQDLAQKQQKFNIFRLEQKKYEKMSLKSIETLYPPKSSNGGSDFNEEKDKENKHNLYCMLTNHPKVDRFSGKNVWYYLNKNKNTIAKIEKNKIIQLNRDGNIYIEERGFVRSEKSKFLKIPGEITLDHKHYTVDIVPLQKVLKEPEPEYGAGNEEIKKEHENINFIKGKQHSQLITRKRKGAVHTGIIMPLVEGIPIDKLKDTKNIIDKDHEGETLLFAISFMKELAELHKKKVVHCDIKPANVIYDVVAKKAVIIDYESMKNFQEKVNALRSTEAYISPEFAQFMEGSNKEQIFTVMPAIDIYAAAGVIESFRLKNNVPSLTARSDKIRSVNQQILSINKEILNKAAEYSQQKTDDEKKDIMKEISQLAMKKTSLFSEEFKFLKENTFDFEDSAVKSILDKMCAKDPNQRPTALSVANKLVSIYAEYNPAQYGIPALATKLEKIIADIDKDIKYYHRLHRNIAEPGTDSIPKQKREAFKKIRGNLQSLLLTCQQSLRNQDNNNVEETRAQYHKLYAASIEVLARAEKNKALVKPRHALPFWKRGEPPRSIQHIQAFKKDILNHANDYYDSYLKKVKKPAEVMSVKEDKKKSQRFR